MTLSVLTTFISPKFVLDDLSCAPLEMRLWLRKNLLGDGRSCNVDIYLHALRLGFYDRTRKSTVSSSREVLNRAELHRVNDEYEIQGQGKTC